MKDNININRKELTSSEIEQGKNFDTLLTKYKVATKPFYKTKFFLSSVVIASIIALIAVLYYFNQQPSAKENKPIATTGASVKADSVTTISKPGSATVKPKVEDSVGPYSPSPLAAKIITSTKSKIDSLIATPAKMIDTTSLLSIYRQFDKIPEVFTISSDKDTTLTCAEGTKIKIQAHSFLNEKTGAEIKGTIEIKVKEYYKLSDILLAKLSTSSDSNLLETRGMIHIAAFANDSVCLLKESKPIEMNFPVKEKKDSMQLFNGTWTNNYRINWKLDDENFDSNKIYKTADVMPVLRNNDLGAYHNICRMIKYPKDAMKKHIEGTVYVSFIVYKDGSVGAVKILRGVYPSLDSASLQVVRGLKRFDTPAKYNNRSVNMQMILPVCFSMGDNGINNAMGDSPLQDTLAKHPQDSALVLDQGATELSYYIFSTTRLGWLNCDRFVYDAGKKVDYIVKTGSPFNSNVNIIFHKYRAIMAGNLNGSTCLFYSTPVNEDITIIAIKYENGIPYLAIKDTKTSESPENDLVYKPVTMELLKTEMEKLDNLN